MAPSPSNPRRCTRQQLCFLLPLLLLSGAGTLATADSSSYSSHCRSPAPSPDRHTDVGDDVELLKPFHLSTGFFSGSGAGSLLIPDDPGSYFSFLPQGVSRTADPALLHLTATLTLFGRRDEQRNISSRESFWRMYDVAISFYLDGYYSPASSELCMVGTGTEFADTDRAPVMKHYAGVAVHLRVPSRPSLTDPFVTGRLEGADFETVSLVAYAEGDAYSYSGRASASCPPAAGMATARRPVGQPQHGGFSCAALRSQLILKYRLEYVSQDAASNSSTSLPLLHEPAMMVVNQVRCAANGAVRLYAVFFNDRRLRPPMDSLLVEEQAVVADGFWDAETSRLCLHACLVVRSASTEILEVRECGIGMSFWFPAVWTVRDRIATAGLLWNASGGGNSNHAAAGAVSNPISASSFQERIRTNLSDVKYNYNQTMLETATRHYLNKAWPSNASKIMAWFLGNHTYSYRDLEFTFFTDHEAWSGRAYPVSIGSAMVDGDKLAAEYSFSWHAAAEMKQSRLVNVSYGILYSFAAPSGWPSSSEIKAEGVYDTKTGFLSMVVCRELNVTTDCQVLIAVQFLSLGGEWQGFGKGSISSLRRETDVLHFKTMNITVFGMSSQQASESIWRMDLESIVALASATLSCAFAVLQILHAKRNRDAAPNTSITMLVVLALGHATPLALDLAALLANRGKRFVQLSGNGLLELIELVRKAPALIAFTLQLRLLHLAWSSRRRSSDDRRSGAEWRVLRVCLPLYLIGAAVAAGIHAETSRAALKNPLMVRLGRDAGTLGEALASYAGLVLDGFLLPQVVLNAISGSSAKAISPWFYVGGTATRVAPHVYDVVRARRYVQSIKPSYVYASPRDGLFGVAWDIVAMCVAASLALLLFLQQRLGGDFFQRWRSRSSGYEMVSTFRF